MQAVISRIVYFWKLNLAMRITGRDIERALCAGFLHEF